MPECRLWRDSGEVARGEDQLAAGGVAWAVVPDCCCACGVNLVAAVRTPWPGGGDRVAVVWRRSLGGGSADSSGNGGGMLTVVVEPFVQSAPAAAGGYG